MPSFSLVDELHFYSNIDRHNIAKNNQCLYATILKIYLIQITGYRTKT